MLVCALICGQRPDAPHKSKKAAALESLRHFPVVLAAVDNDVRQMYLADVEKAPDRVDAWLMFLVNESKDAQQSGQTTLMEKRWQAAAEVLGHDAAEAMKVQFGSQTAGEKRKELQAMRERGVVASGLYLVWAKLERDANQLDAALEVLDWGLKVGSMTSPGRGKLEVEQDKLKDLQMAMYNEPQKVTQPVAVVVQQPVAEDVGTVKKPRTAQSCRRLGRIGGMPVRVAKQGAQQPLDEDDEIVDRPKKVEEPSVPAPAPSVPRMADVASVPMSPLAASEESDGTSSRRRRVMFASPAPAPAGPRIVSGRPGSMSPAPAPSLSTACRQQPISLSLSVDPSLNLPQTPKLIGAVDRLMTPARKGPLFERAAAGASPSSVAPRVRPAVVEESSVALVTPLPLPVEVALPAAPKQPAVVAPAKPQPEKKKPEDDSFSPGREIEVGDYKVTVMQVLGVGGYSRVYKVFDAKYNVYALKELIKHKDADQVSFLREVAILQKLKAVHSASDLVVQLITQAQTPERSFLMLEAGELDLQTIVGRARRQDRTARPVMPMAEVKYFWSLMLRAVQVLHDNGVVHCDLKPANFVMFQGRLKAVDFGISVELAKREEQARGTLAYLPPEMCRPIVAGWRHAADRKRNKGPPPEYPLPTFARDIWALGCILFQISYGQVPFPPPLKPTGRADEELATLIAECPAVPVLARENLARLNECILFTLQPDPTVRPTAAALLRHSFLD